MRILSIALLCLTVVSCSWWSQQDRDEYEGMSTEQQFYEQANRQLGAGNYSQAVATYEALESRFPFGQYASQAQLELIYAHFRSNNLEAARAAADRFIRLHPDHRSIDYAYYMKGVASFSENSGFVSRFLPTDSSKRDITRAQDAFNEFSLLLSLYPDSDYAADARARMVFLRNTLAQYEMHVADYYMERRAYIAALNRSRYVVENFQGTPQVADALSLMVECYMRLGLDDLADTSLALLRENYPGHETLGSDGSFTVRNHVTNPSLLYTASFGLLGSNEDDTPLAPTSRPDRPVTPDVEPEGRRSLLNILTLGLLGDDGSSPEDVPSDPPPAGPGGVPGGPSGVPGGPIDTRAPGDQTPQPTTPPPGR
ncbi:MAG: outer membrane protein assembly factor BamD [Pseudohongiellaceae bacterium]